MRLSDGSTCSVIRLLTSFSVLPILSVYSCDRENWTEGGFWRELASGGDSSALVTQRGTHDGGVVEHLEVFGLGRREDFGHAVELGFLA